MRSVDIEDTYFGWNGDPFCYSPLTSVYLTRRDQETITVEAMIENAVKDMGGEPTSTEYAQAMHGMRQHEARVKGRKPPARRKKAENPP